MIQRHPQYPLVRMRQVGDSIILYERNPLTHRLYAYRIPRSDYACEPSFMAEVNITARRITAHTIARHRIKENINAR